MNRWFNKRIFKYSPFSGGVTVVYIFFLLVGIFAPVLANDRPLMVYGKEGINFPFLTNQPVMDDVTFKINPPVPFSPTHIDPDAAPGTPPLHPEKSSGNLHVLGTDLSGRDILSGMIHGTRTALVVGISSMLIAGIIGLFMGFAAGMGAGKNSRRSIFFPFLAIPALIIGFYQGFILQRFWLEEVFSSGFFLGIFALLPGLFLISFYIFLIILLDKILIKKWPRLPGFYIRRDALIMRTTDIVRSFPAIYLLLGMIALAPGSGQTIIIWVIGLTFWPEITIYVRGEVVRWRESDHVTAARSLGIPPLRLITRHILPQVWPAFNVVLVLGMAAAISTEAYLSFLGIGQTEMVSWGSLLADSRTGRGWWMAIFPGLTLFILLLSLYHGAGKLSASGR